MNDNNNSIVIAHISDLHVGSQYFISNIMERIVHELNELKPDAIISTGDLVDEGYREEYKQLSFYLDRIECESLIVVPGNHDSRNVGYLHFEDLLGSRNNFTRTKEISVVGVDSSEPDLDSGQIGRERQKWIMNQFSMYPEDLKILALHHHLIPVPGTGRERNIVQDAGDVLEILIRAGVDLVLCGHKHVPYVWKLENLILINAGTASSLRLRGRTKPCYNVIYSKERNVRIYRKFPFGKQELIVDFSLEERKYCKWEQVLEKPSLQKIDGGGIS